MMFIIWQLYHMRGRLLLDHECSWRWWLQVLVLKIDLVIQRWIYLLQILILMSELCLIEWWMLWGICPLECNVWAGQDLSCAVLNRIISGFLLLHLRRRLIDMYLWLSLDCSASTFVPHWLGIFWSGWSNYWYILVLNRARCSFLTLQLGCFLFLRNDSYIVKTVIFLIKNLYTWIFLFFDLSCGFLILEWTSSSSLLIASSWRR